MKHAWAGLLVASLLSATAGAQGTASASEAAVKRARAMAVAGNATGARAVLDSALAALPASSPEGAVLLYARATTEESAAGAERDYRRVVVEYPTAAVAEESTLRLAQLELQRGDGDAAIRRLERLRSEQPSGAARGRTTYWLARAYLEGGDAVRGCAALGEAAAQVGDADVEVRNQVAYYAPRCRAVATADPAPPAPAPVPNAATAVPPAPRHAAAVPNKPEAPRALPRAAPERAAVTRPTPARAAAPRAPSYTVQTSALQERASALAVAKRLKAAGFAARVEGSEAPFRVRIGRYPTRAAAEAVAKRLRARKSPALVVEAGPR